MRCDICERDSSKICCTACARHSLWPIRYDLLIRSAEKAAAEENIKKYITDAPSPPKAKVLTPADEREVKELRGRTEQAKTTIDNVMQETEKIKREIANGLLSGTTVFPTKH